MSNKESVYKYRKTKKGLSSKMYFSQKRNSIHRGHEFPKYSLNEFRNWLFNQKRFNKLYNNWAKSGYSKNLVPSCDRIDDNIAYSFDNIVLKTWKENNDKFDYQRVHGLTNKQLLCVDQLDVNNNFINSFYSINEASRRTGINNGSISSVCNGTRETAGGYIWKFKNN